MTFEDIPITNRVFFGVLGGALCSGIALANSQPVGFAIGWALIGFAIAAALDFFLGIFPT